MTNNVALCGLKGSGKTWLTKAVLENVSRRNAWGTYKPVKVVSFADPIYMAQAVMFSGSDEINSRDAFIFNELLKQRGLDDHVDSCIGMSPRQFRQSFGTDFMRDTGNVDIWVAIMRDKIKALRNEFNLIIPDVRFNNEMSLVKELGFKTVYVNTISTTHDSTHGSEKEIRGLSKQCDVRCDSKKQAVDLSDELCDLLLQSTSPKLVGVK